MPGKKYIVNLSSDKREELTTLVSSEEAKARKLTRAPILLKADEGWTDKAISETLNIGTATVERVRKRFVETGLEWKPSINASPGGGTSARSVPMLKSV